MDQASLGIPSALENTIQNQAISRCSQNHRLAGPPAPSIIHKHRTQMQLAEWVGVRQDAWGSVFPLQPPQVPATLGHHLRSSFRPTKAEDPLSVGLRSFKFGNFSSF